MQIRHLVRSSLLVLFLSALDKVTGFAKLLLMTNYFGTGAEADALASAAQLPELLQAMLLGGALAAALIPVYSAYLTRSDHESAQRLARTVLTLTVIIAALACGVTALIGPWLVRSVLVPGFSPAQQQITTELMRIYLLAMGILSLGSITAALLHARQHFLTPALGGVVVNCGQVVGIYLLTPTMGIHGAAWGSVIGIILLVSIQLIPYINQRIGIMPLLDLHLAGLHELLKLMWPRLITLGVFQAADLVFVRLASGLPNGVISAFFFATLIMVAMPKSLVADVIKTVFFPTLADQFNTGELDQLKRSATTALRAILALLIPLALGVIALGPPLVAFIFERGEFDSRSTALVYSLATVMVMRLIAEAAAEILTLPFYAHHNTRVPMWASIGWGCMSVTLYYLLVGPLGIYGLALASTLSALALVTSLYVLHRRIIGPLDEGSLLHELARILLASGGMCAVILGLRAWLGDHSMSGLFITILAGGITYLLLYGTLAWAEIKQLLQGLGWPVCG